MEQLLENNTKNQTHDVSEGDLAPPPARLLSAFVDYLLNLSVFLLLQGSAFPEPYYALAIFSLGLLYYGFGNSSLFSGQTLGKRFFGIRTVSIRGDKLYLSPWESITRYFISYGLIVFLAEAPFICYRISALSAPAMLLDLPLLFAFYWCFQNLLLLIAARDHRAAHDWIAQSCVLRSPSPPSLSRKNAVYHETANAPKAIRLALLGGAIISLIFWLPGVIYPEPEKSLLAEQYVLAHDYGIRLISAERTTDAIVVDFLTPSLSRDFLNQAAGAVFSVATASKTTPLQEHKKLIMRFILEHSARSGENLGSPNTRSSIVEAEGGQLKFLED